MRYWFDTEFIDDGRTIDLISIGIVSEDGRTYYAEHQECDLSNAGSWVREHVFPLLSWKPETQKARWLIGREILEFCGDKPEFWAWFGAYDWVALCQLYGRMIDLPKGWPMRVNDVAQFAGPIRVPQ